MDPKGIGNCLKEVIQKASNLHCRAECKKHKNKAMQKLRNKITKLQEIETKEIESFSGPSATLTLGCT